MPFDVEGARKAGFRDDEILSVAAKELGISEDNLGATLKSYSPTEVLDTLSKSNLPAPNIGKPFTEEQPSVSSATKFGKYMENLSRPNYASAQAANALLEGKPVIDAVKKGFSLKEPMVYGDVIQNQMEKRAPGFTSEHPSITAGVSTVGGLAADVALDPTTYLPGGVGLLWKGAKKIPGVAAGAAKLRSGLKEQILGDAIVSDVGRLFSNNVGNREHREAYSILKKYEDLRGYRSSVAVKEMAELDKQIVKLAKETGEDISVLRGKIIDSVEKRLITDNPSINDVVDSLVKRNEEILAAENAAGVGTAKLTPKINGEAQTGVADYFVHALSDEGKKWLEKNEGRTFKGVSRNMTDSHASMLQRKYGDMSISEVNDMMRKKGMKGNFFLVDPARAQAIRDIRSARSITGAEFYDEMANTFGVDIAKEQNLIKTGKGRYQYRPDGVSPSELVEVKAPSLKGKLFTPEVANIIDSHYNKFTNPEEVNTVLRTYDAAQNWWKAWTLGVFPAYHARNMAGNIWNNSLAGVNNPKVYKYALDMQRGKSGILKTATGDMSYEDVIKLAGEKGVMGKGFYGGDIPGAVDDVLVKGKWLTLGTDNKLVKTGRKVGTAIEDNARLAHFIDKITKGMDADTAAASVKKFLFDYSELTQFEQGVMKRVFPFYSWSRKNIPLQMEMMVRKPGQQLLPVKLKHEIERNSAEDKPIPESNLPEWLVGDYPIRTSSRHKDESDPRKNVFSYTPLAGYLPWGDMPRFVNNPSGSTAFMVSPLIKEPVQQALNYDAYFKQSIANPELKQGNVIPEEGEEFTRFMGVKLTPRAAHVARNIRLLATLNRANPFQIFGESTSELGTGEKLSQYILGARTYDVDEVSSLVRGMYSEKRKMDGLRRDLYLLGRELGKAQEQGKDRAAKDAKDRIEQITNAISRIGTEEVPKHIAK